MFRTSSGIEARGILPIAEFLISITKRSLAIMATRRGNGRSLGQESSEIEVLVIGDVEHRLRCWVGGVDSGIPVPRVDMDNILIILTSGVAR